MEQHNYEDLNLTDTPSKVPIAIRASSDHPFNRGCVPNPMATQCNQSQYPNPSYTFALPKFMAQCNCEDLKPTDSTDRFESFQ